MEAFVKESLRSWGVSFVERECTKDYHVPEQNITIPKGSIVQIPAASFMHDDRFFKDPDAFDPEGHFDSETLIPSSFFSFGQGPRNCIGMRFAWTLMKSILVRTVYNYKVLPGPEFPEKFIVDPMNQAALCKNGVHVKLSSRKE